MTDTVEKDIQKILKYVDILEKDNYILRQDRSFQEKTHNAWIEHANAILEQQTKQTTIMENLLITLSGVLYKNQ
jgi:hypothetical protein